MGKPVIYLYPEKETKVFVNVKPKNGISISEPKINNGWNVIATPEGKIKNIADNKTYPYLFWEGFAANFITPKEGFVVRKENLPKFFDEKLSFQGLNKKEISDFKEYWIPVLKEKPYYFITFIDQDTFNNYTKTRHNNPYILRLQRTKHSKNSSATNFKKRYKKRIYSN